MATTLNKFHREKGVFPDSLMELYPEFVSEKAFITALDWHYKKDKSGFILKRSIKGQNLYASINSRLKFVTGRIDEPTGDKQSQQVAVAKVFKKEDKKASPKVSKSEFKADIDQKKGKQIESITAFHNTSKEVPLKKQTAKVTAVPAPSFVKESLGEKESYLQSFNNSNLYIWKTPNGTIGFSNIEYPKNEKLVIYDDNGWIKYLD
jgi:hypothetical protein